MSPETGALTLERFWINATGPAGQKLCLFDVNFVRCEYE